MKQFRLPDPGEGLVEAEIVSWHVQEGDRVEINDIIVDIETSKSIVELPSPYAGTVAQLLVAEGATVEVGTPIIVIDDGVGAASPAAGGGDVVSGEVTAGSAGPSNAARGVTGTADDEASGPLLVGYGARPAASARRARVRSSVDEGRTPATEFVHGMFSPNQPVGRRADEVTPMRRVQAEPTGEPLPSPGRAVRSQLVHVGGHPVLAKPPVRKLAKDLGVDLTQVSPTGPEGRITRADVEAAAALQQRIVLEGATFVGSPRSGRPAAESGRSERRVPIKGVRKLTAQKMVASAFTAVHVTEWVTIDITATMELVEQLKARREFAGLRISPLLLYAKAICLAMARNPDLNATWDEKNQEIVYHDDVNLGIAAATPRGLLVPNIKGAQRMNLLELCQAVNHLVDVAREGRTSPADTAHGTFTLTNVGVFGIDAGTPILNAGESGIVCMGSIERRPWVVRAGDAEQIVPRWVTTIAMSFDHRLVDGEQGSTFLADLATILSEPSLGMLF